MYLITLYNQVGSPYSIVINDYTPELEEFVTEPFIYSPHSWCHRIKVEKLVSKIREHKKTK